MQSNPATLNAQRKQKLVSYSRAYDIPTSIIKANQIKGK